MTSGAALLGVVVVAVVALVAAAIALLWMRRAAQVAEAGRRTAEDRFRAVFNASGLGICTVGKTGQLMEVNPTLERMLGYRPGSLSGRSLVDVTHPEDVAATRQAYARLEAGEAATASVEKRYLKSGGGEFWGNMTLSSVRDREGKVDYFVAIVEDIEERRLASDLLVKLNRDKSHFVSLVSHEFRTALTGIQGFSEMLRDEPNLTREEAREYAGDINGDAQRLGRMINELLDLERMESGHTVLHLAPVDLATLVREALDRAAAGSSDHTFEMSVDGEVPAVVADADKVTQVLANLIGNAIKYSPAGGQVEVRITAAPEAAEVAVTDHGLGIPPEHRERIFERYARIESANTRYVAGTGLGLPIVKQIVEMHGGRVGVTSEPGAGSTFTFTLPRSPAEPVAPAIS